MSRESAFGDLFKTDGLVHDHQYGDQLTLPPYVHDRALDALEPTIDDGSERSIHFRHQLGRWRGGMAVAGIGFRPSWFSGDYRPASTSRLHDQLAMGHPPHLHLHTHPQASAEMIRTEAEERAAILDAEDSIPAIEDGLLALDGLYSRFPSAGDVRDSIRRPHASVAHLIIAEGGIFAWVHRQIPQVKGGVLNPYGSPLERRAQKRKIASRAESRVARHDALLDEELDPLTIFQNLHEIEAGLVLSRAEALRPAYVCYMSGDPENPVLTKLAPETV